MVKKKKAKVPRRLGDAKPLMVRGTRIYYHYAVTKAEDADMREHSEDPGPEGAVSWIRETLKQLQRGEIAFFNGIMIRPSRRGRWAYQLADGIWSEVRFVEDIPVPWDDPFRPG